MGMALTTKEAIKKTLAYAAVFNFPLTSKEIYYWLAENKASLTEVQRELNSPPFKRFKKNNYSKRKKNHGRKSMEVYSETKSTKKTQGHQSMEVYYSISKGIDREVREKIAQKKWRIAKKTSLLLSKIPTVQSVLVTGNLSMNNADEIDDIDLFIITKKNTMWTTRLLSIFIAEIMGIRRHPKDKKFRNKICLNMFLDEDHLILSNKDRNVYIAHEVLQAKPLFDKESTYTKFIRLNVWVKKYLPNAYNYKLESLLKSAKDKNNQLLPILNIAFLLSGMIEHPLSWIQKIYLKSKRTSEIIEEGVIRFHPRDTRNWVINGYQKRLKHVGFLKTS